LENKDESRRIVWLTESKSGIYVGLFSGQVDSHSSYHQDGTRHWRIKDEYHQRWKDVPLRTFTGAKQLQHGNMSLLPPLELKGPRHLPSGRDEVLLVPATDALGFSDLALDVWLSDKTSARMLERLMESVHTRTGSRVVAERRWGLDSFPNLLLGLSVSLARGAVLEVPG